MTIAVTMTINATMTNGITVTGNFITSILLFLLLLVLFCFFYFRPIFVFLFLLIFLHRRLKGRLFCKKQYYYIQETTPNNVQEKITTSKTRPLTTWIKRPRINIKYVELSNYLLSFCQTLPLTARVTYSLQLLQATFCDSVTEIGPS